MLPVLLSEVQILCVQGLGSKGFWLPRGARDRPAKKDLFISAALYTVSLFLSFVWYVAFMSPIRKGRHGCSAWIS